MFKRVMIGIVAAVGIAYGSLQAVVYVISSNYCADEAIGIQVAPDNRTVITDSRLVCGENEKVDRVIEVAEFRNGEPVTGSAKSFLVARAYPGEIFGDVAAPPAILDWQSSSSVVVHYPPGFQVPESQKLLGVTLTFLPQNESAP